MPCRTHVLHADHGVAAGELGGGLEEQLLLERIAHLHGRQVGRAVLGDVLGRKRGALDAVLSGGRSYDVDRVARAAGLGADDAAAVDQAHAHGVDEGIDLIHRVEVDLPAHDRHAEAVAVVADAADDAVEQPLRLGVLEVSEAEGVELGNGPGAHGEDVAVDAAHAGRRPLVGLERAGVVVALDLEGAPDAVADVDDAGVLLTRLDQQVRAVLGQGLQPLDGVLVAAVLGPHHRVDAHLGEVGGPSEDLFDQVEFLRAQAHFLGLLESVAGQWMRVGPCCERHPPSSC